MKPVILKENPYWESSDCPECGVSETAEVWFALDLDQHPELAYRLMNGLINFFRCNNCGYVAPYENVPFVIHDGKKKSISIYIPETNHDSQEEKNLILNSLMTLLLTSLKRNPGDYFFRPSIFSDLREIIHTLWGENMFAARPKAEETLCKLLLELILIDNGWVEANIIIQNPILTTADSINILQEWSKNEELLGNIYGSMIIDKECELLLAFSDDNILEAQIRRADSDSEVYQLIKKVKKLNDFEKDLFNEVAKSLGDQEAFIDAFLKISEEINDTRRLADFPRGINLCRFFCKIFSLEQGPEFWASVRGTLGVFLMTAPIGDKATQLEEAITCFQDILKVYASDEFPKEWAQTHSNLGSAYNNRINENKSDNIERAIYHFQKALEVKIKTENDDLAATLGGLGNSYLDRILGERRENQEKGIGFLEKAISLQSIEVNREWWYSTINNLALAYLNRLEGNPIDNTEKALHYVYLGLEKVDQKTDSEIWARMMSHLGDIYSERIAGNKTDNIEEALSCYQKALQILNRDEYTILWGNIQMNYAITLQKRIKGNPKENNEHALLLYEEILRNVEMEYNPELVAKVYLNYGGSIRKYSSYSNSDKEEIEHLHKSIDCYVKVVGLYSTHDSNPIIWGAANHHLALVYKDLAKFEGNQLIITAIEYAKTAIKVFTKSSFPREWASVAIFLGSAYHEIIDESVQQNIEEAIKYTNQALEIYLLNVYPYHWAMAQHNLGNYFQERTMGEKAENVKNSIKHYLNALRVFDSDLYPEDALRSNVRLGALASDIEDWKLAYDCFDRGINALTRIRVESNLNSWFEIIQKNIAIYSHAIKVSCLLGKFSKAFEYVEGAKSRKFLGELATTEFHIPDAIPSELIKSEEYLQRERQLLRKQLETSAEKNQIEIRNKLRDNAGQLTELYKNISIFAPDYVDIKNADSFSEEDICSFLNQQNDGTTVISIFDQPPDSVLIFCWKAKEPAPMVLNIPLTNDEIMAYLANTFNNIYDRPPSSGDTFTLGWKELSTRIVTDKLSEIFKNTKRLIILPYGIWYLFPLHLLLWKGKTLIESFPISFSPSLSVLSRTRSRQRAGTIGISSIGYVEDQMLKDNFEGEAKYVANLFKETPIVGELANIEKTIKCANDSKILHISSHGVFDSENPLKAGLLLYDGTLTAKKVMEEVQLPGSLVCLSACMTAVTRFERGDERIGLIRAFLYSGASSIISSMWSVNAKATRELMEMLYFHISMGTDRDIALQKACLDLKTKSGMEHPYYWAPFVLYGDWRSEIWK